MKAPVITLLVTAGFVLAACSRAPTDPGVGETTDAATAATTDASPLLEAARRRSGIQSLSPSMDVQRQVKIPVEYKGRAIGEYRLDLLIENKVIVEIKSVERYDPVFEAQILTYLKITGKKVGLLINFNSRLVKDGIRRFIL